jgi:hypothetical protein
MDSSDRTELKTLNVAKLMSSAGYQVWSMRLQMFLMGMKLWSLVDGTRVMPSSTSVDLENMEKWNVDEAKAKYYIMSTISDEVMINPNASGTAKELWDSIAKTYGVAGEERVYQLYFNLMQCRMNGGTASEHVAKLKGILQQIVSVGESLSDKFKIAMLLGSLTDEYNVKKQVLIEQKGLSFEDACASIIGHVVGNSDTALSTFTKSNSGGKRGKGKSDPKKYCTKCKKDGHTVQGCFQIHGYPKDWPWHGKKKDQKEDGKGKGKEVVVGNMAQESAGRNEAGSSKSVIILTAYVLSSFGYCLWTRSSRSVGNRLRRISLYYSLPRYPSRNPSHRSDYHQNRW